MNNSKTVFFSLIRAGLWEKDIELAHFGEIDYNDVYRLAEEQSVLGLVAAGIEHVTDVKVPQEVCLQFVGQALKLEQRNTAMNIFVSAIIEKLRAKDIYALLLKGQGIAQCYERPLWRASGDVDLFLSDSNCQRAKELLAPMASSVEKEYEYERHLGMSIGDFTVELHGTLHSGLSKRVDKGLDKLADAVFYEGRVSSWMNGKTQIFIPAPNEDVIYVFTHYLQHFYKGGVGLRQICDWCRQLWTYRDHVDVAILEKRLRSMGLITEWKAFGAFAVDYLGMPKEAMPFYSSSRKWKRKAKRICSFIMEVGNMGHNRDRSYFDKPYIVRKAYSFGRRCGDLIRHSMIFPLSSLRFFPCIFFNGLRSAINGEG